MRRTWCFQGISSLCSQLLSPSFSLQDTSLPLGNLATRGMTNGLRIKTKDILTSVLTIVNHFYASMRLVTILHVADPSPDLVDVRLGEPCEV